MISGVTLSDDFMISECYSLIVKISSLLVYFDFKLEKWAEEKYKNYKQLFQIGTSSDLPTIFIALSDIESGLRESIERELGFQPAPRSY